MTPQVPTRPPVELSERQRAALISLLADDDPAVCRSVTLALQSYGVRAIGWLEPYRWCPDPLLRRRAVALLEACMRELADQRFLSFCQAQPDELPAAGWLASGSPAPVLRVEGPGRYADAGRLEEGVWLMAQTRYPSINPAGYQALLDDHARQVRCRLDPQADPRDWLGTLNRYLFEELGFAGDEKGYYNPENSYLNRVLDRRAGNPISLSVVYFLIARRLGLPVTGIGMPGHFVCRYQTSAEEIFIDPFGGGRLMSRADCVRFLVQSSHGFQEGYLAPCPPRRILLRACSNLHQIHVHQGQALEVQRLQRYIVALARQV